VSAGGARPPTEVSGRRKWILFVGFAALSLILDQWTKSLAREFLRPLGPYRPKVVIDGFFNLRYSENPGVAFGLLQQLPAGRMVLTLLAIGAFGLVILYLRKSEPQASRLHIALGLVGGGAAGNLIDRLLYGRVTDFVVWHIGEHEWPAFNVADAALCVGVGLLVLDMFMAKPAPSSSA
jgi:signal peptidase II